MNAAIYSRCSTSLQDVDNSLDAQERELRDRAERDGCEVVQVYRDAAEPGRNEDRPEFQRMIIDAKRKRFSRLYCYDVSRGNRGTWVSRRVSRFRVSSDVRKNRTDVLPEHPRAT